MNKIKIAVSYLFFPMAMGHYLLKALQRRDDVEVWTCGPYSGNWIPWNNGMYLDWKHVIVPDFALPHIITTKVPSALIDKQMPWKPDLFLMIDAGFHFTDRPNANMVVHIQTDPHVLKAQYREVKAYADLVFSMQNCYRDNGEYYLPYGFDPTIHYPMDIPKIYDACLIGLHYSQRDALVNRLRQRGLNVYYSIGEIYDDYRERYNQSRIALSWSSLEDTPARVFEACGMALPLVANRTPDLSTFFVEGEHYLGFGSVDEAEAQVVKLLGDPELMETIGNNAYRKALACGTWDLRIRQLLDTCKLI